MSKKAPSIPVKKKGRRSKLRKFFVFSSWAIGGGTALALLLFSIAWARTDLPPDTPLEQTTYLVDATGKPLAAFNAGENRTPTSLDKVPEPVRQAVLDVEDHNFYAHRGVDPRGILRALYVDLKNQSSVQGGSTITQQYVKQVYVGSDRTASRKIREAIIAMKLERKLSKDEIFERYLNAIYFGRGAYGIEAASKNYFGKSADKLTLEEGAYLAGLIRAPELADAYRAPDVADGRRNDTLDNMVRFASITPEQAAAIKAKPVRSYTKPRTAIEPSIVRPEIGTQYYVDYVKQQLISRYGEQLVEGGGLRVTTSLDLSLQAQAHDAVYGFLREGEPAGALVSVDENGAVKAMVGGRDYKQSQVNLAVGAAGGGTGRQAGSTMKPFALAAGIEDGMSIRDTYPGPARGTYRQENGAPFVVNNFGNEGFGTINLNEATVKSVNTVYAQLGIEVGIDNVAEMAEKAGVKSPMNPEFASIVLGSNEVTVLEMANAYMTFGRRGAYVEPRVVLEVKNAQGETLEKTTPRRQQVMKQATADTVNFSLQQNVQRGTGTRAQIGKPLAGKTGTTEDNGDAWFVGYTPKLATAVWMGYPEGSARKMSNVRGIAVTGGTFPSQIFQRFMSKAVPAKDNFTFVAPPERPATRAAPTNAPEAPASTTTTTTPGDTLTTTTTTTAAPTRNGGTTTTTTTRPIGALPRPSGGVRDVEPVVEKTPPGQAKR